MKRFLIIGGATFSLVVCAVFAACLIRPDIFQAGKRPAQKTVLTEDDRRALAVGWIPPVPSKDGGFEFPLRLENHRIYLSTPWNRIGVLKIRQFSHRGEYHDGNSEINLHVSAVTPERRAELLRELEEHYQGKPNHKWEKVDLGDDYTRVYFTCGSPFSNSDTVVVWNYLWFTKTHLVALITADREDREPVLIAFFHAGQAPPSTNR